MTTYLFVHQNFPGQFIHVARALAERGDTVVALGEARRIRERKNPHPRVQVFGYETPDGPGPKTHHYVQHLEGHVRRGQSVFRLAQRLVKEGLRPDIVVAHPGWGETLFLKDIFPQARHIHYLEFFYRAHGADVGFDPESPRTIDTVCRVRIKNATQLLSFEYADAGVSPTQWQKSVYPAEWQPRIAQIHDGIDTVKAAPFADARVIVKREGRADLELSRGDEVLTYVARNLEPYRGFHSFMRALPSILEQRPHAHVIVVGGNDVSYGQQPPGKVTYRDKYLQEWGAHVDTSRVHFVGKLPYAQYLQVLQVSSLHVYLTYPFVLSWSMLEAMSAGCAVLASDTAPVQEVIKPGENGFLTNFFAIDALANRASELLAHRQDLGMIRQAARATIVNRYDLERVCLPQMLKFLTPAA